MAFALAVLVAIVVGVALALAAWRVTGWADLRALPTPPPEIPAVPDVALVRAPGAPAILRDGARPAVVLVHGILGFDAIGVGPLKVPYFRRAVPGLVAAGHDVAIARLPPLGSVPARAAALARLIEALPNDRVTLVAHSMGGLDARWALTDPAIAARVASLVTIGTPHRGTPIADLFARGAGDRLRAAIARLGLTSEAVEWLTTWRLAELNRTVLVDAPGVRYASIVAATVRPALVHPLLRVTHAYLARTAGANDGVVPASSQPWGEVVGEEELDHWAQVGWRLGWRVAPREASVVALARALDRLALPSPPPRRALTAGAGAPAIA